MIRQAGILATIGLALAAAAPARAAIKAEYAVLDNGLKVILFPDKQSPMVGRRKGWAS